MERCFWCLSSRMTARICEEVFHDMERCFWCLSSRIYLKQKHSEVWCHGSKSYAVGLIYQNMTTCHMIIPCKTLHWSGLQSIVVSICVNPLHILSPFRSWWKIFSDIALYQISNIKWVKVRPAVKTHDWLYLSGNISCSTICLPFLIRSHISLLVGSVLSLCYFRISYVGNLLIQLLFRTAH